MQQLWIDEINRSFSHIGLDYKAEGFSVPATLGQEIQAIAKDVPGFDKANLSNPEAFSLYRTFLYTLIRNARPKLVIETGVLNGFSSAFILQALEDNNEGRLISIDLPHNDGEYEEQGTFLLPKGKGPGWAIPDRLRHRHSLHLGKAEVLLPQLIDIEGAPDIFLHDSDHRYPHMMMEIAFAWSRMTSGFILSDNVEQNTAFQDFATGVGAQNTIVSSYNTPSRVWQHGFMRK